MYTSIVTWGGGCPKVDIVLLRKAGWVNMRTRGRGPKPVWSRGNSIGEIIYYCRLENLRMCLPTRILRWGDKDTQKNLWDLIIDPLPEVLVKKSPRWRPSSADAQGAALTCKFREGWQKLFISNYSSWVSRKNCVILPAVDRITQISHISLDWSNNAIFPTCIHRIWEGYLNPSLYVIDFLHFSQWSLEAHLLKCS